MNDPFVDLYSKDDCHLCEAAKEVMLRVKQRHPFWFREIKIQPGTEQYEQLKERIPVVFVNEKFAFQHKVSEEEFVRMIKEAQG